MYGNTIFTHKKLLAQRKAVKMQVVLLKCQQLLELCQILLLAAALELFPHLVVDFKTVSSQFSRE